MRLVVVIFIPLLLSCYPHWGKQVREDSDGWIRHADNACARGDRRAANTFLLRAWELDGSAEERLDGELCPAQASNELEKVDE